MDWIKSKLNEIANLVMGQSPDSQFYNTEERGMKFLQGCAEFGKKSPSTPSYTTSIKKIAPENSILFSVRAPVGKINLADDEYCIGRGLAAIVPTRCDLYFLYQVFLFHQKQAKFVSQGSTFDSINSNELSELEIQHPLNISEQSLIAKILNTADKAISQTEALIAKYHRIKTGLMQDLLTRGIDGQGNIRNKATHKFVVKNGMEVPEEWEVEPLGKAMEIIDCKHVTPKYIEEGVALLRPRNIKPGGISFEDIAYISESDFDFLMDKHKPQQGDIVFTRNASFGVSTFIESFTKFAIGQDVVIMTKKGDTNSYFIFLLLNSVLLTQIMNESAGSTFGRINLGNIRKLKTVVPSPDEQNRISNCLNQLETFLNNQTKKLGKLQTLKTGLMQDLLSGKVRVKVKED